MPQIDEMDRHLDVLHNSRPPISQLPPEVLIKIFREHQKNFEEELYTGWGKDKWFLVTHVCHNWRELAINCPNLWTRLYITGESEKQDRLEEFLRRSQALPLSVLSIRTYGYDQYEFRVSVISRFLCEDGIRRQIRGLHLALEGREWGILTRESPLPAFAPSVLDHLEDLSLSSRFQQGQTEYSSCMALLDFFANCTFQLKKLRLDFHGWHLSLLNDTLTSLELAGDAFSRNGNELYLALASLKRLEHLALGRVLRGFDYPDGISPGSIEFPQLQSLWIQSEPMEATARFLKLVSFPFTSGLLLEIWPGGRLGYLDGLLASLSQYLSHTRVPHFQSLSLGLFPRIGNEGYLLTLDPSSTPTSSTPHFTLSIEEERNYDEGPRTALDALPEFLQSFSTRDIRHLYLHGTCRDYTRSKDVIRLFASLPSLITLRIEEDLETGPPFVRVLDEAIPRCIRVDNNDVHKTDSCETCRDSRQYSRYFATLERLEYAYGYTRHEIKLYKSNLDFLRRFLAYRQMRGYQNLRRLVFEYWGSRAEFEGQLSDLEPFCDEILWLEHDVV